MISQQRISEKIVATSSYGKEWATYLIKFLLASFGRK
jgi:hypothetical protein